MGRLFMLLKHVSAARLQGQSSIVFVPTRRHARLTTMDILDYAAADGLPHRFLQVRRDDLFLPPSMMKHLTTQKLINLVRNRCF